MFHKRASLGPARCGRAGYLVATKAVAGVHDEGLPPVVVLPHIQALVDAEVPDLQNGEREGNRDNTVRNFGVCSVGLNWCKCAWSGFSSAHDPRGLEVTARGGAEPRGWGDLPGCQVSEKPSAHGNFLMSNDSPRVIPGPSAAPEDLLEMSVLRPRSRPTESAICFNVPSR